MFMYIGISNEICRVECFVTKFTQKLYEILTYLAGMPEWMEAFRMVSVNTINESSPYDRIE